ncbi:DgyrCDS4001 [Dimorphilus gyrociliatus]|nr:DgyrCDS4001 [Dimorphilus gyrociliatus]
MGPVSERDMAYQMDCYFRQSWVDKRLQFDSGEIETLRVSITFLEKIWKPDTHFLNGKQSYLHTVTSPNKLLRVNKDGRILYSMRLTIKATCPMHLENFPMDTQNCPLRLASHGYDTSDVLYVWTYGAGSSIKMASDMTLSQFDLIDFPQGNRTISHARGQFSLLHVTFTLKRHMGYFLINVYVPCSLLVILSWVAFWINREATADRMTLGITTVLTMVFVGVDNRDDLPKVSYSTALDYFVNMCFAFVLAAIIQFASVHFFTKHGSGEVFFESDMEDDYLAENDDEDSTDIRFSMEEKDNSNNRGYFLRPKAKQYSAQFNGSCVNQSQVRKRKENCCYKFYNCLTASSSYRHMRVRSSDGINSVSMIDKVSRILFPTAFIILNIFYWNLYLGASSDGIGALM